MHQTFNPYTVALEPVTDLWPALRSLAASLGGWSFVSEQNGVIRTDCDPSFFRFEEEYSCADPKYSAYEFKELAGKMLAERGIDFEIEIDALARPERFDVRVVLS